jgi:two-component system, NarL family, response regulator NreC
MEITKEHIKILIAEDQGLIRHALASLLRRVDGFEVIGLAGNGVEVLKQLETARPDIILMDIKMPQMNGIEATKKINEKMPWIKIIGLSMYDHPTFIKEMLRNGAKGFLSKDCAFDELRDAIQKVFTGETYLCKNAKKVVIDEFSKNSADPQLAGLQSLTPREIEIIQLLAEGNITREIANKLFISEKTVDRHKTNILNKLNLKNTAQLVKVAVDQGIILS